MSKKSLLSVSVAFLLLQGTLAYADNQATSEINFDATSQKIGKKGNEWFKHLDNNIVVPFPQKGTLEAELDRQISWDRQKNTPKERIALAKADQDQSIAHIRHEFRKAALGELAPEISDKQFADIFYDLEGLADYFPIRSYDPNEKRARTFDFILKDKYLRGRPYQVLDDNGNYKDGYEKMQTYIDANGRERKNSSYPSGHTSNGFGQAVVMAMAFPERGQEIFSRALQYGESRVVVGAHFPTDTMTSRLSRYYYMAQLLNDADIAKDLVHFVKEARQPFEQSCDDKNLKNCLEALPQNLHQEYKNDDYKIGYYGTLKNNENIAINPADMPDTSEALLRLRFSYLDNDARRQVLASTAYQKNSHAQMGDINNPNHNWGLINLPKAYDGIAHIYQDIETTDKDKHLDFVGFSSEDTWKNNISGTGKLILNHQGKLTLSGDNTFAGATVKQGHLVFTGNNKLSDTSHVKNGQMSISGQFDSKVVVENDGKLVVFSQNNKPTTVKDIELVNNNELYIRSEPINQVFRSIPNNQVNIQNLSGNGQVIITENANTHIDTLSGATTLNISPTNTPATIGTLQGKHGIIMPSLPATDEESPSLLKINNNQGELYLIDAKNNAISANEQGAYAYQLVMRPNNTLQFSRLSNNNEYFASSATKTALNTGANTLYNLDNQINTISPFDQKQSVWVQHQYNKQDIDDNNTNFELTTNQTTLGFNTNINQTNIGTYITKNKGDVNHTSGGKNEISGTGFGLYATHALSNQREVFIHGAWQNNKQEIRAKQANHDNLTANTKDKAWGITIGGQQKLNFNHANIQPFFSISHLQSNPKSFAYEQLPNLQINPEKATMTTVNLGTTISKNYGALEPYIKANVFYQDVNQDLIIDDNTDKKSTWKTDLSGVGVGGSVGIKGRLNSQFDITGEIAGQYHEKAETPIQAKLALNYQF